MSIRNASKRKFSSHNSYPAALILFGGLLPIPSVATIITAAIYITPFQTLMQSFNNPWLLPNWVVIGTAFLITLMLWLFSAFFFKGFTSVKNANPVSGSHLKNHFCALRAGFDALNAIAGYEENIPSERKGSYQIAKAQVGKYLEEVEEILQSKGPQWIAGTGYLSAWNLVHRAEEAMITLEPRNEVIREAFYDELCLTGSPIDAGANLLEKLRIAIYMLSPSASNYLDQSDNDATNITNKKADTSSATTGESIQSEELNTSTSQIRELTNQNFIVDPVTEMEALNILRDVRRTINEYRDRLWEGLVTERNQLMGTAIITGLLTYVLLCFTIIAGASTKSIIAVTAFYLVGSLTGLFSQLYSESKIDNATDNYDLTLARIIITPVLSGLTAIGGVLLTTLISLSLIRTSGQLSSFGLQDGFNLQDNPLGTLIAAAFSLTPKLLIGALTQKAQDFTNQLQGSNASEQITKSTQSKSAALLPAGQTKHSPYQALR